MRCLPTLLTLTALLAGQMSKANPVPVPTTTFKALQVLPATVELAGIRATGRLIVSAQRPDGTWQDVTAEAVITPSQPDTIQVRAGGQLAPVKDGAYTLKVSFAGLTTTAKATVKDSQTPSLVSFNREIVPILTRNGCNQGACHGAQFGKGGFKLSLAGFDPELDYQQIAQQIRGRRLSKANPKQSLFLTKPLMWIPHGGGKRLDVKSPEYAVLLQWIREGASPPNSEDPAITKLEVYPAERIMPKGASPQQILIRAVYNDGTSKDVTAQARLNTLNDGVASCTPEGLVTPVNRGQTAIMIRYGGQAAVAAIMVPYAKIAPKQWAKNTSKNPLDGFITKKQQQLGLIVSPLCDDTTFIRRASLDIIGTTPTPQEIGVFTSDITPNKREKLVDSLLARPEYADYWTVKWGDLLRSNRTALGPKGMWSFTNWIRTQFRDNRPVDGLVHDLLLAQGSAYTNGPSNYYRVASNPQDLAETTSQLFLGVRLQCAKCHNHPFEKWSQKDYYQFAAYFARIGLKGSQEFGLFGNEQVVRINDYGDVYHPKSGKRMYPSPLGAKLANLPEDKMPNPDSEGDRRQKLAEWLVDKNNPLFAVNIANRYWGYMMGRGIVNPIDDIRTTNPPSNPQLLTALADILVKNDFSLKVLVKAICTTEAYQRSSQATLENRYDENFWTHYTPKRMTAEVLLDAIDSACGTQEKFPDLPLGTRAIQLPDPQVGSEFLDTFGRPLRLIACECERTCEPNLSQTLRMMNGELVNRKVSQYEGRISKMVQEKKSDDTIITDLYLRALGRSPTNHERNIIKGALAFSKDRKPVFEDVLITLINSKEFLFNH